MAEIRFITEDEVFDHLSAIRVGFGGEAPADADDAVERYRSINRLGTAISAFDRGHIVATFGSYDLDLSVPGGLVPMAGTTHVTVHPTHRRRGILTEMMDMHLRQAVEEGKPMATLWASDERIYGRFGYGPAAWRHRLAIPAGTLAPAPIAHGLSVHPLTVDEARTVLPPVFDRHLAAVAGSHARTSAWWQERHFRDPTEWRGGASQSRYVVAERDGEPAGYVSFRVREGADGFHDEGFTEITELVGPDDDVRRALWQFVTNVDLFTNVKWWNAPVDEPIGIEIDRYRLLERALTDSIWVRLLDVAASLEARRYDTDGALTIEVGDEGGPAAGRFRIEVDGGKAAVTRTDTEADVALGVADLGRLYLGHRCAHQLRRAGLVEATVEATNRLDALLGTATAPHCIEVF